MVALAGHWQWQTGTGSVGDMASKVWFITGASRGFGKVWAQAALARGDRVAATARDVATLKPLVDEYGEAVLPLLLDVTDRRAAFAAVDAAAEHFGQLDIVVNNAGYGLFGTIEEITEEQARAQIDANLFGALWVTQAALPILRAQGSGHILQVSSIGGIAAFPMLGLYNASKWALEAFSESLAQEVAAFGIKVTLVEPGPYGTDWSGASAVHTTPHPAYESIREARRAVVASRVVGDPATTAAAILTVVDAPQPPLRIFLGRYPYGVAERAYQERLATWQEWRAVAETAHG
jgi:NAD(P)-dependent dehydrogenase (short-subunit alcohol dehydrogenase family)